MRGRIIKGLSGLYEVRLESGTSLKCRARGAFRRSNISPLPGDLVDVNENEAVIEQIYPRKNALIRPPVANVDLMFVVVSTTNPEPSLIVTDKLIAVCEENDIEPIIVINKTDLKNPAELYEIYSKAGFTVILASAENAVGANEIKELINGKLCVFGGNSGVGKSSLLNLLGYSEEVGEISHKNERGRHTTKRVELFEFFGGYIADTPGFGDVAYEDCLRAEKGDLKHLFREFEKYFGKCRFADCVHINEPDCAVKAAVEQEIISKERYENYKLIYDECSHVQKR